MVDFLTVEMEHVILVRIVRLVQGIAGHVNHHLRHHLQPIVVTDHVMVEKRVHPVLEIVVLVHHLHQLR